MYRYFITIKMNKNLLTIKLNAIFLNDGVPMYFYETANAV